MPGAYLPPVVTRLEMNIEPFISDLTKAKAAIKGLDSMADVEVDVNTDQIDKAIAKLETFTKATEAAALAQAALKDSVSATNDALSGQADRATAAGKMLSSMSRRISTLIDREDRLALAAATANAAMAGQAVAAAGVRATPAGGGGGGGGFWGLGGSVTPWQGTALAHATPIWHPIADAVIESVIALGAALVTLAAAGAVLAPAFNRIYDRMHAIHQVTQALGADMGGLGGAFTKFSEKEAPMAVEAFGGVLNMFNHGTGTAAQTIQKVIQGLDDVIAKLDIFSQSHSGSSFFAFGLQMLHQMEQIAANLGKAFVNIIHADPGTIHYLLDLVTMATKFLDVITSLPTPWLRVILQIHSAWLWGGLLYNQLAKIPGVSRLINVAFGGMFKSVGIDAFLKNVGQIGPALQGDEKAAANFEKAMLGLSNVIGIAVLGAAIVELAIHWNAASASVTNYVNAQNQALGQLNASQAMGAIPGMIGGLNSQIGSVSVAQIAKNWNNLGQTANSFAKDAQGAGAAWAKFGHDMNSPNGGGGMTWLKDLSHAVASTIWEHSGQAVQAAQDIQTYRVQIQALSKDQQMLFGTMAGLMKQGFSTGQALGIMNLAQVTASDSAQLAAQKVQNLLTGYREMGIQGNVLANSVNAVNFQLWQQDSTIQTVTAGWTAFISTITAGPTALQTFLQGIITFKKQAGSLTGLDTNSLTKQTDFTSNITNASSLLNSLYTYSSTGAMGSSGMTDLTNAGRDIVAQLIPGVRMGTQAFYQLYAVAQQGGYTGAESLKGLAQWMSHAANPSQQLNNILTKMMGTSANLTQDVQNLSTALNTNLASAMSQALVQASGGTKVLTDWANAVLNGTGGAKQMATSAQGLYNQLVTLYGNTAQGVAQFEAFNGKMGVSKQLSDQLWQALASGSVSAVNKVLQEIALAEQALHSLNGQTATVYINGITQGAVGAAQKGVLQKLTSRGYASGTGGAANGWAWVGEKGPELVNFRGGETVIPNHVAKGYASGTGDMSMDNHVHVYLDGRKIYKSVQKSSVVNQRRTGQTGVGRRTR